jgi:hypothetical protein
MDPGNAQAPQTARRIWSDARTTPPAFGQQAPHDGRYAGVADRLPFRHVPGVPAARLAPVPTQSLPPGSATYSYTFIDVPGAAGTYAGGLNLGAKQGARTTIVGGQIGFLDAPGFTLQPKAKADGISILTYKPLEPTQPVLTGIGINDDGDIAGTYQDNVGQGVHGFLLAKGKFSSLNVPFGDQYYTEAVGVNNSGLVIGVYSQLADNSPIFGFTYDNGNYAQLSYPSATQTQPSGVNNSGDVTGNYADGSGIYHGFLLKGGTFMSFDVPNSTATFPTAVNDSDVIVGTYCTGDVNDCLYDLVGVAYFIYNNGTFTALNLPWTSGYTNPYGIDDAGDIVGSFTDQSGLSHGFLLTP